MAILLIWLKNGWHWIVLHKDGVIISLLSTLLIFLIKKARILFVFMLKKLFFLPGFLWGKLRNKPLIDKLQAENKNLKNKLDSLNKKPAGLDILGEALGIVQKDSYPTYDYSKDYENMCWGVSIKYDPSKSKENTIIFTDLKGPRCPKCKRDFISENLYWGAYKTIYECPNPECKNQVFSEHSTTALKTRVTKDAEGQFRDIFPTIPKP